MQAGAEAERFVMDQTAWGTAPLVPELQLRLASEVTPLWHATEALLRQHDIEPPFWAFAWPGAQLIARWMLDAPERWAGRTVLDLGGGGGLAAIAAARCGARAILVDVDPLAAAAATVNARANGVTIETVVADVLDTGADAVDPAIDTVVIGDLFYSLPLAARVERLARQEALRREVYVADPGRAHAPAAGVEVVREADVPVPVDLEGQKMKRTRLLRVGAGRGASLLPGA